MSGAPARLAVLRDLARLKADRETARLAAVARSRTRLRAALDGLGQAEAPLGDGAWRAGVVDGGAGGGSGDRPAAAVGVVAPGCDPGARGGDGPALSGAGAPVSGALTGSLMIPDAAPGARGSALMVRARLAHAAWISAQRAQILARLALVEADWHRLLPPAARAFGQAEVLDRLSEAARRAARSGRAETAAETGWRRPAREDEG